MIFKRRPSCHRRATVVPPSCHRRATVVSPSCHHRATRLAGRHRCHRRRHAALSVQCAWCHHRAPPRRQRQHRHCERHRRSQRAGAPKPAGARSSLSGGMAEHIALFSHSCSSPLLPIVRSSSTQSTCAAPRERTHARAAPCLPHVSLPAYRVLLPAHRCRVLLPAHRLPRRTDVPEQGRPTVPTHCFRRPPSCVTCSTS